MELMLQPYAKYADFSGRARRSEYWSFVLLQWIVGTVAMILMSVLHGLGVFVSVILGGALVLFSLYSLVPSLAVLARRLHDTDRSAAWIFIAFVPFIGGVVLLIFSLLDGVEGDNRYGPDPKGRTARSYVSAPV